MQTSQGSRLIRKWIRRPLLNKDRIFKRLNRIEELIDNHQLLDSFSDKLKHIFDID